MSKRFFREIAVISVCAVALSACSTNPATGDRQFTALMSPAQEGQVGAQEHQNVLKQYGLYQDRDLQNYVKQVGGRVVKDTERPDVLYQFFLLDSPMVNAFALPGGYIYITRGLLSLSNSEAEMAAVLAHEAGHITARHSAERYSRGVVTSLGAAIIAAAVGNEGVSQALGLGSDLYIKSYSRGQENQADGLGIRYLSRAGYDPRAMSGFLSSLQADTALDARLSGDDDTNATDYFSTHPATAERVALAAGEAAKFPPSSRIEHETYLRHIDGMTYGDSPAHGFIKGQNFYHPEIGFAFTVPPGFRMINQPTQVLASAKDGTIIVFDMQKSQGLDPLTYLKRVWAEDAPLDGAEQIDVNGMPAATGTFAGTVNGQPMTIRLIVVQWGNGEMARFLFGIPSNVSTARIEDLKRTTYSLRRLSPAEKSSLKPYHIKVVAAKAGDTVASLSANLPFEDYKQERFRVLNGLKPGQNIQPGNLYKLVVE